MTDRDVTRAPAWEEFFAGVGNETWLAARAVLEADSRRVVSRDAARWLRWSDTDGYRDDEGLWRWEPELDWEAWVADVDGRGRGWSSTEWRLFEVAAGLTVGRPFNIVGTLDRLDSWTVDVWRALLAWGVGVSLYPAPAASESRACR